MRLMNKCRAADNWLLETKFQKWSEWSHNRLGLSTIRMTQICFAIAAGSLGAAYVKSIPANEICWALTAGCGFVVILLEVMELLRRKFESRTSLVFDLSDVASPNLRLVYIAMLFAMTGLALLGRTSGVPTAQTLEPAFMLLGIISMIAGLYFASCKGKPRKPKEVLSLKFAESR